METNYIEIKMQFPPSPSKFTDPWNLSMDTLRIHGLQIKKPWSRRIHFLPLQCADILYPFLLLRHTFMLPELIFSSKKSMTFIKSSISENFFYREFYLKELSFLWEGFIHPIKSQILLAITKGESAIDINCHGTFNPVLMPLRAHGRKRIFCFIKYLYCSNSRLNYQNSVFLLFGTTIFLTYYFGFWKICHCYSPSRQWRYTACTNQQSKG